MARKKSDRRYTHTDGSEWDSKFEFRVYSGLKGAGYLVRRCQPDLDSIAYHTPVQEGSCLECGSENIIKTRSYTPDLLVVEPDVLFGEPAGRSFVIECKGHFPQARRAMLGYFKKQNPSLDLRFLFYREQKVTPLKTNLEYVVGRMKCPAAVWDGDKPEIRWRMP